MIAAAHARHDRTDRRSCRRAAVVDVAIVVARVDDSACRRRGRCCCGRTSARWPCVSPPRRCAGNVPPIVTPGSFVFTSPVVLRYSRGAFMCGSNVSTCVGPPASHSQMTEVSLTGLPWALASARAANSAGKREAPRRRARRFSETRGELFRRNRGTGDPENVQHRCPPRKSLAKHLRRVGPVSVY